MKNIEYWQLMFDEQSKSGLTQRKFCESKGVSYHSFCARKLRMNRSKRLKQDSDKPKFIRAYKELVSDFTDPESPASGFKIETKSGVVIRFPLSALPSVLQILNSRDV